MKKMKKMIALLVALFIFAGNFNCLVTHAETSDWSDIESVTVEATKNEYYEYTNGYYASRNVSGTPEQFYCYNLPQYELTVNHVNGDFEVYQSYNLSAFYSKYGSDSLSLDDSKQVDNPWGVGQHSFLLTILGHQVELDITILERPFTGFTVIANNASVKENTKGYMSSRWDSEKQEQVSYWRYYDYADSCKYILSYEDGTEETFSAYELENRFGEWPESNMSSLQYNAPFEPGTYEIIVTYMGLTSNYDFTIVPFSPEHVEVVPKDNTYMEGTNGCFSQRYNEETQQNEEYWSYREPEFDIKMTFEDGSEQIYSRAEYSNEIEYLSCSSDQSASPWGVGEHYFTVKILGITYQIPVTITETNIATVEAIPDITEYVKNTHGAWSGDEWNYQVPNFKLRITYKDGSTETTSYIYSYSSSGRIEGDTCIFNIVANNMYKTELRIALIESPVSSIEVLELERVSEYENSEEERYYSDNPVSGKLRINYKDGTSKIAMLNPVAQDGWNGFAGYSYGGYPISVSVGEDLKAEIDYLGAKAEYQLSLTDEEVFSYFEQEGKALIYAYIGAIPEDRVLTIPSTLGGLPVVGITDMVGNPQLSNVTELVIPDSVISISENAISQFSNLNTLRLGSGIGYLDTDSFVFNYQLKNIHIDNEFYKDIDGVVYTANGETLVNYPKGRTGVYTIPSGVLNFDALPKDVEFEVADASSLTVVDGVTYTADMKAVVSCDSEKTGEYIMPDTVVSIYNRAFSNCDKLEDIKISKNVTEIVYGVFNDCSSLKSVDFPASLKKIYSNAFYGADALEKVVIHDVAAWCDVDMGYGGNPIEIAGCVYLNDALITDLVIPEGVTEIRANVFSGADCIKTLALPTSLASIKEYAFRGISLEKLTISDMAKWCEVDFEYNPLWITDEFYLNDELIIDLVIPEGVTEITDYAFSQLPGHIKTLFLPSTMKKIGHSFGPYGYGGSSASTARLVDFEKVYLTDLAAWCMMDSVEQSPLEFAQTLYINDELVEDLQIPEGVTRIVERAFEGCKAISSVSFPSTIENIGQSAFQKSSIKSYSFAPGVGEVTYGDYVFRSTALLETNLGAETTHISQEMFAGSDLKTATIPVTVTEIAYAAFGGCSDLLDISAPETLISIKAHAFDETEWYDSKEDGSVYFGNNFYRYKGNAKDNTVVELKEGTLSIAESAFENIQGVSEVKLPDSLQLIGNYAFDGSGIRTITISKNVETIGDYAFMNCADLSEINISAENDYYASMDGILYNKDLTELIRCPEGKTGEIVLPKTVKKIRSYAFSNVGNVSIEINNPEIVLEDYSIGYAGTVWGVGDPYGEAITVRPSWIGNNDIEIIAKENSAVHQYATENYLNFTSMKMESVSGHSISLRGDVAVNFYMKLSEEVIMDATAYMQFTMPNGEVTKVMVSDARVDSTSGNFVFPCDVSAAEMTDTVKAQIITGVGETQEYTYNVKSYADYILSHTDVPEYAKAAPLVKAMLNYGGYSQKQFNHNTNVLANAGLYTEETDPVLTENVSIDNKYTFNAPKDDIGLKYYGSSLLLNSNTTVRHYFNITGEETLADIKVNYEFTLEGGTQLTPKMSNGMVYVDIVDIKAAELDDMYTVSVTKGTATFDVTYSPFSYAKHVLEYSLSRENLTNVIKAMCLYNAAANTYFD